MDVITYTMLRLKLIHFSNSGPWRYHHAYDLGPLLLTWFNFNPSMDK